MQQNKIDTRVSNQPKPPLISIIVAGATAFMAYILICIGIDDYHVEIGIGIACLFLVFSAVAAAVYFVRLGKYKQADEAETFITPEIYEMFKNVIDVPYAIIDTDGIVKIINGALARILDYKTPICNIGLDAVCDASLEKIVSSVEYEEQRSDGSFKSGDDSDANRIPKAIVTIRGRRYRADCSIMHIRKGKYYFVVFTDMTDLLDLRETVEKENVVLSYIVLDNLQEIAQYVQSDYRTSANEIEKLLRRWALDVDGFLREYDRDKYMLAMSHEKLVECEKNGFKILNEIRSIKMGDGTFPITISMGIADIDGNMEEKEKTASAALEVALQRGGDQVVLKREDDIVYFGGRIKTTSARTPVRSRVNSNQLCKLISKADHILIMGHKNPDFDSIGSCVGLARLAMTVHSGQTARDIKIVVDKDSSTFKSCAERLSAIEEYRNIFIDSQTALDRARSDGLLIISDVNNQRVYEAPDLAENMNNIAIIDHHILFEEFKFANRKGGNDEEDNNPIDLCYIEPDASSASELVCEMIEHSPYHDCLHKEEANLMLAGIMLDTHNFTHNVKDSTFAAFQFLYNCQARPDSARTLFDESLDDYAVASDFGANARSYKNKFAITYINTTPERESDDRIAASKAADKLLLIKGIEASFAMVRVDDGRVFISARSNGNISVQKIAEKLGGGGHYDMAGAQVKDQTLEGVGQLLRDAIDEYLEELEEDENSRE